MSSDSSADSFKVIAVNSTATYLVYLLCQDISSGGGDVLTNFDACRQSKIVPRDQIQELWQVERVFQDVKTLLETRPIFHQRNMAMKMRHPMS